MFFIKGSNRLIINMTINAPGTDFAENTHRKTDESFNVDQR